MQGKLEKKGHYDLFETTEGHQILNLNDKHFFAVVKGKYGDILVGSNADHEKKKTLHEGHFYLADFEDDPEFKDMPHLFLEEGNKYREWILPNDYPTKGDYQKKLIKTGDLVDKDKVKYREKQYQGTEKEAKSKKEAAGKGAAPKKEALEQKTKDELYEEAKKKDIEGRSEMNKEELVKALAN